MKKIYFLIAMVTATVLASCTKEQEDFFSDSSANRADAAIAANIQVLTSATNGWLMKYYPEAQQSYGGYNLIARFSSDGTVEVISEFDSESATSLYSVTQSAGITLTFDTYNVPIHQFSDPGAPLGGNQGTGLDGDYDFSILSATSEQVVLKGKKTGNHIVMTPMADTNWTAYFGRVAAVEASMLSNFYQVTIGNTNVEAAHNERTLVFNYQQDGEDVETVAPYIVNPDGIEFYEPVEILGATLKGFKYADGSLTFDESTGSGLKLSKLKKSELELLTSSKWYVAYSLLGDYAQKYWEVMYQAEVEVGESVGYAYLNYSSGRLAMTFYSSGYVGNFYFAFTPLSDNEVTLKLQSYDSNGQWYYKYAGWNYATAPFKGTFKLSVDDDYVPSYIILEDVEEPTNVITLSLNPVYYPFSR